MPLASNASNGASVFQICLQIASGRSAPELACEDVSSEQYPFLLTEQAMEDTHPHERTHPLNIIGKEDYPYRPVHIPLPAAPSRLAAHLDVVNFAVLVSGIPSWYI